MVPIYPVQNERRQKVLTSWEKHVFQKSNLFQQQINNFYCGQAQQGVCTAEDGRRENVVQLRTLKRTRLALQEHVGWKHRQLGYIYIYTERKKNIFRSVI